MTRPALGAFKTAEDRARAALAPIRVEVEAVAGQSDGQTEPPWEPPEEDHAAAEPEPTYADRLRAALVRGDDIMSIPAPAPLIDGLLDLDTLALLFGPSGCTKTFVALDLALSVATSTWWHGREVHAGPVLYIVAEGLGGIGARVDAWRRQRRVQTCGESFWLPMAVSLLDAGKVDGLVELVREMRPRLVVADTFARCMVGGDENTAKDVGLAVESAERLRRASGACVLIVHHSGKDATLGARGSSALRAAVATEIECSHADGVTTLRQTKQKDHEAGEPYRLALVPIGESCALDRYTGAGQELSAGAVEMLAELAAIVADEDGVSASVWRASSAVAERSFYRWQKQLIEAGYCHKAGAKSQARYTLTEQGKQAVERELLPTANDLPGTAMAPGHQLPPHAPPLRGAVGSDSANGERP